MKRASSQVVSRVLLGVLLLVLSVSAVGCNVMGEEVEPSDDPKLFALKHERMATFRPPGGRIMLDLERTAGTSFKPHDASITRVFAYRNPERARRVRLAAIEAAQSSGWKLNLEGADESPIFGRKTVTTGGITLIIGWYVDEGLHRVSIRLEHDACGRGRCRYQLGNGQEAIGHRPWFSNRRRGSPFQPLRNQELVVDDSGRGFVYRFPDRDWKLVFGRRAPEVGERVNANGRAWTVVQVRRDFQQRPDVHLELLDVKTGPNTASDA